MEKYEVKREGDIEKYLHEGNQTVISPEIIKIVENIKGSTEEKIGKILDIVSLLKKENFNKDVFRKRTAAQILNDGYFTGCTDVALAYIALARANGIPSKYIETIDIEWLKNGGEQYSGHIYSQSYCEEERRWTWVDPMMRSVGNEPKERVVYKEGLDSWDIGIQDFDSLQDAFNRFRDYWLNVQSKE